MKLTRQNVPYNNPAKMQIEVGVTSEQYVTRIERDEQGLFLRISAWGVIYRLRFQPGDLVDLSRIIALTKTEMSGDAR